MAWPTSATNEDVKKIGAAGAPTRDYADIATWEADTDNDNVTATVSPVGECYADAVLGDFTLFGGYDFSNATYYRRLTVAVGERHDGTAYGGGVESSSNSDNTRQIYREDFFVIEGVLFTGTGSPGLLVTTTPANARTMVRDCIAANTGAYGLRSTTLGSGALAFFRNCVAHGQTTRGISGGDIENCSIWDSGTYGVAYAVSVTNTIAIGAATACYFSSAVGDYNIGGDATAPGDNSIDNIAGADIFANVGAGTEDLHLLSGATAAAGAGTDLSGGTYPFTTDIDGETRVAWDIGADEYSGGEPPAGNRRRRLLLCGRAA